nr:hypothetical protein [Tanacetum cinerariifolium]
MKNEEDDIGSLKTRLDQKPWRYGRGEEKCGEDDEEHGEVMRDLASHGYEVHNKIKLINKKHTVIDDKIWVTVLQAQYARCLNLNGRKKRGFFQKYIFQVIRKKFQFKIRRRFFKRFFDLVIGVKGVDIKDHSFSPNSKIKWLLFDSNHCIYSVKKRSSQDKGNFTFFFHFENNKICKKAPHCYHSAAKSDFGGVTLDRLWPWKFLSISFIRSQASVRNSFSCWEKAQISQRSRSKRAGGKNRLMKAVRSSSHVLIVPSLSSSSHVFASLVIERGNIIRNGECKIESQYDNKPDGKCDAQSFKCGVLRELRHYFDQTFNSFDLRRSAAHKGKKLNTLKLEKDGVDGKLAGLLKASKNLDNLIESQRSDKVKDRVGYNDVPPSAADLYLSPKKDLSWTGLPEFADDTVTDYNRPSPTVESTSEDGQNQNSSAFENGEPTDSILSKPAVKFVKVVDRPAERPTTNKAETVKKHAVKYAEMYRRPSKKPTVKGNQRNWNNLKTQRLGPDFVLKKKACFNCGDFSHLANDCRKRVQRKTTRSQNHAYMSPSHISAGHRPHGAPMRPPHRSAGHRPHGDPMRPSHRPVGHRPHDPSMRPIRSNMNGAKPNRTSFNKQRVQRLERELKARALIHKGNSGTKLKDAVKTKRSRGVGDYILQVKKKTYPRNLIADAASSLREDCWDLKAFNSRNLIADAASSLGEDCWELNV